MPNMPRILSIAGSDSGGGAGIQADIKTITMLGGHAMTAITSVTAQNSKGVVSAQVLPVDLVLDQIQAVVADFGVDAIKIGMIGSAEIASAVAEYIAQIPDKCPIVFDPVMVATSGATLADQATIAAFGKLMSLATLTTPNLEELASLGGRAAILATGSALLEKGGHGQGDKVVDRLLRSGEAEICWSGDRIDTPHSHGTGCTLSSAIAVYLAQGLGLEEAIAQARLFVRLALRDTPELVDYNGPMGHGHVRLDAGLAGPILNQVTIGCSDYNASVSFYKQLGFRQIVDAPPRYARFETMGGATFSLHGTKQPAGDNVIYFECADLDERCAVLQADGVIFTHLPQDESWGWREARLRDPHGNTVCLYLAGENRRYPPWRID